jgi:hypothetical protein
MKAATKGERLTIGIEIIQRYRIDAYQSFA